MKSDIKEGGGGRMLHGKIKVKTNQNIRLLCIIEEDTWEDYE